MFVSSEMLSMYSILFNLVFWVQFTNELFNVIEFYFYFWENMAILFALSAYLHDNFEKQCWSLISTLKPYFKIVFIFK